MILSLVAFSSLQKSEFHEGRPALSWECTAVLSRIHLHCITNIDYLSMSEYLWYAL